MASFCTRRLLQQVSPFFSWRVLLVNLISPVVTRVRLCCAGLLIKHSVHTLCLSHMQFQWTYTHTCAHSFHPCWFTLRCRWFAKNSWTLTRSYSYLCLLLWYLFLGLCCCLVRTFLPSQMRLMSFHSRGPGDKIILMWLLHKYNHCVCFMLVSVFLEWTLSPESVPSCIILHSLSFYSLFLPCPPPSVCSF